MASSRKSQIKSAAKKANFLVVGDFIICFWNEHVVSGIAIDAAPAATHLWIFILPMYDDLSFLHMTLGERVVECDEGKKCFQLAYAIYEKRIASIKTPAGIVDYMDRRGIEGNYSKFVRYLSYVRDGNYQAAENYYREFPELSTWRVCRDGMRRLKEVQSSEGWSGVQRKLDDWMKRNIQLLGVQMASSEKNQSAPAK